MSTTVKMKPWLPNHFVIGGDGEFIAYILMYGEKNAVKLAYKVKITTDNIIKSMLRQ